MLVHAWIEGGFSVAPDAFFARELRQGGRGVDGAGGGGRPGGHPIFAKNRVTDSQAPPTSSGRGRCGRASEKFSTGGWRAAFFGSRGFRFS